MKNKKLISLLLAGAMVLPGAITLAGCTNKNETQQGTQQGTQTHTLTDAEKIKNTINAVAQRNDQILKGYAVVNSGTSLTGNTLSARATQINLEQYIYVFTQINMPLDFAYYFLNNASAVEFSQTTVEAGKAYSGIISNYSFYDMEESYSIVNFKVSQEDNYTYVHLLTIDSSFDYEIEYDYQTNQLKSYRGVVWDQSSSDTIVTGKFVSCNYLTNSFVCIPFTGENLEAKTKFIGKNLQLSDFLDGTPGINGSKYVAVMTTTGIDDLNALEATFRELEANDQTSNMLFLTNINSCYYDYYSAEYFEVEYSNSIYTNAVNNAFRYAFNRTDVEPHLTADGNGNFTYDFPYIDYTKCVDIFTKAIAATSDTRIKGIIQNNLNSITHGGENAYCGYSVATYGCNNWVADDGAVLDVYVASDIVKLDMLDGIRLITVSYVPYSNAYTLQNTEITKVFTNKDNEIVSILRALYYYTQQNSATEISELMGEVYNSFNLQSTEWTKWLTDEEYAVPRCNLYSKVLATKTVDTTRYNFYLEYKATDSETNDSVEFYITENGTDLFRYNVNLVKGAYGYNVQEIE